MVASASVALSFVVKNKTYVNETMLINKEIVVRRSVNQTYVAFLAIIGFLFSLILIQFFWKNID
jgi:hypothetical protein